jgi:hypothetical protein
MRCRVNEFTVVTQTMIHTPLLSKPLSSNGRPLRLRYSVFQAARHNIIQIKFMCQRVNLDNEESSSSVSSRCLHRQRGSNINAVECQANESALLFTKLNPCGYGRKQHSETEISRLSLTEHLSGRAGKNYGSSQLGFQVLNPRLEPESSRMRSQSVTNHIMALGWSRAVQRGARGRHGARDILSWRPTLLCRL